MACSVERWHDPPPFPMRAQVCLVPGTASRARRRAPSKVVPVSVAVDSGLHIASPSGDGFVCAARGVGGYMCHKKTARGRRLRRKGHRLLSPPSSAIIASCRIPGRRALSHETSSGGGCGDGLGVCFQGPPPPVVCKTQSTVRGEEQGGQAPEKQTGQVYRLSMGGGGVTAQQWSARGAACRQWRVGAPARCPPRSLRSCCQRSPDVGHLLTTAGAQRRLAKFSGNWRGATPLSDGRQGRSSSPSRLAPRPPPCDVHTTS